jgi:hypothetical protein
VLTTRAFGFIGSTGVGWQGRRISNLFDKKSACNNIIVISMYLINKKDEIRKWHLGWRRGGI